MFHLTLLHPLLTSVRAITLEEMIKRSPEKVCDIGFDCLYDFDEYEFTDLDDENILIQEMKSNWFYSEYESDEFIECPYFPDKSNQYIITSFIPFYLANEKILEIEMTYSDGYCHFSNTLADQIYSAADDISSGKYGRDEKTQKKLYHKLLQEALVLFEGFTFYMEAEEIIPQKIKSIIEYAAGRVLFPNSTF